MKIFIPLPTWRYICLLQRPQGLGRNIGGRPLLLRRPPTFRRPAPRHRGCSVAAPINPWVGAAIQSHTRTAGPDLGRALRCGQTLEWRPPTTTGRLARAMTAMRCDPPISDRGMIQSPPDPRPRPSLTASSTGSALRFSTPREWSRAGTAPRGRPRPRRRRSAPCLRGDWPWLRSLQATACVCRFGQKSRTLKFLDVHKKRFWLRLCGLCTASDRWTSLAASGSCLKTSSRRSDCPDSSGL